MLTKKGREYITRKDMGYVLEGKDAEGLLGRVKHPISGRDIKREIQQFGFSAVRNRLKQTLGQEMAKVRRDQKEKNSSNPKGILGRNLIMDVDESMGFVCDMKDGEKYDLRFFSAVDTRLDYAGGFDFWIELYDLEKNISIADYKIDLTVNPNKINPSGLADAILYFDDNYIDPDFKGEIDPRFFESDEYKSLVELAARRLAERANIKQFD